MIVIESRIFRPNGDYYTVLLSFEEDLSRAVEMFRAFGLGYYAATGCVIGWEKIKQYYSPGDTFFKIPQETEKLAEFLKSKGFGNVAKTP